MLENLIHFIVYETLKLPAEDKLALALEFFLYNIIEILFLIFVVVTFIAFIRTFFQGDSIRKFMQKARFGSGNAAAALFGSVTPFCSCSSIPIFLGFLEARIPLGIAFSFLITSPLVNEVAFVIMGGLFGWKLAILYAISGIILGVIGGMILGSLKLDKEIILKDDLIKKSKLEMPKKFKKKIQFAVKEGFKTFKELIPYVLGGMAIGAFIHGFVPENFFFELISKFSILSVPIATLVGIPVYAGCSTVVPLIFSITAGGVPLGTSLAFMMSIAGLSLPEAVILKKVMSFKLLGAFFGLVAAGIVMIGILFNVVNPI